MTPRIDYIEVYISHTCNLNCTSCINYNNYAFRGHQRWADYGDIYRQWSNVLDIKSLGLLGGEPMLNPDFLQWVDGLTDLWPETELIILTNGTQISRWPALYDRLLEKNCRMRISAHGKKISETIHQSLMQFLVGDVVITAEYTANEQQAWRDSYQKLADPSWPSCDTVEQFDLLPAHIQDECREHRISPEHWLDFAQTVWYTDCNGVRVQWFKSDWFNYQPAARFNDITGMIELHDSDPVMAIQHCCGSLGHYLHQGRLYKCNQVAILPDFIDWAPNLDIEPWQRDLIKSYQPAQVSWSQQDIMDFVRDLQTNTPIENCRLCPGHNINLNIEAGVKKIKFVKHARNQPL